MVGSREFIIVLSYLYILVIDSFASIRYYITIIKKEEMG